MVTKKINRKKNIKKESVNLPSFALPNPLRSELAIFPVAMFFFVCPCPVRLSYPSSRRAQLQSSRRPTYCARSANLTCQICARTCPPYDEESSVSGSVGRWSAIRGGGSSAFGGRGLAIVLRDVRHVATAAAAAVKFVCFFFQWMFMFLRQGPRESCIMAVVAIPEQG